MASQRREGGDMTGLSRFSKVVAGIGVAIVAMAVATGAHAQGKPNILFVMGDDIGWFNIGAYHQGIMAGRTLVQIAEVVLAELAGRVAHRLQDGQADDQGRGTAQSRANEDGRRRDPLTHARVHRQGQADGKRFFVWLNPTRMHVVTHLSDKYESMRTPENGWSIEEAGMAQLDDVVGAVMKKLKDAGLDDNTILAFSTDNGTENFTWPDGGQTPFAGSKGTVMEGGFRLPAIIRWPGKVPAGKVENGIFSGLDWFPTLVAAAGNPNIADELKKGKQIGGTNYKVYLDGYDQTAVLTGKGPSRRHEIFYFAETTIGAVRIDDYKYRFIDQPNGWLGGTVKVDWPILVNLRLDPFERTGLTGSLAFYNWFAYEFWRFVFVKQEIAQYAQTFLEFPPMQKGATFNLEALKAELEKKMEMLKSAQGQ